MVPVRSAILGLVPLLLTACAGVAAGPPPPMATGTAEGLALADATTGELDVDAAFMEAGLGAFAGAKLPNARGLFASIVRPVLAGWGFRTAPVAGCTTATAGGVFTFDCTRAGGASRPAQSVRGKIAVAKGTSSATLRFEGLTVASTWADGRSRSRRVDGTTSFESLAPGGGLRVSRDLVIHTEIVREYGQVVTDRQTRSTTTYEPDSDARGSDPGARGVVNVVRTSSLRITAPDAVRARETTLVTEVPLHWDRACRSQDASWPGFDEGVLVATLSGAGAEARVLRISYAGCGPGAATLDGQVAALREVGDEVDATDDDTDGPVGAPDGDVVQTVSD